MTENERLTINGKEVILYREVETNLYRFSKDAVDMLLEALEEREQYRAIGTVELFKQLSKQFKPHIVDETSCHLRNCNKCDKYRKENEQYHAIGTVEEFKVLKEKNVAKKPYIQQIVKDFREHDCYECPNCDCFVGYVSECQEEHYQDNYCPYCGQKLDWQ